MEGKEKGEKAARECDKKGATRCIWDVDLRKSVSRKIILKEKGGCGIVRASEGRGLLAMVRRVVSCYYQKGGDKGGMLHQGRAEALRERGVSFHYTGGGLQGLEGCKRGESCDPRNKEGGAEELSGRV